MSSPQSQSRPVSRRLFQPAIGFVLSLSCCLLLGWHGFPVNKPAAAVSQPQKQSETSSISLFAAGRGNPYVNVTDGRPLSTLRALTPRAETTSSTAQLTPLALTSGDFTGDGLPDLVSTYTDGFQGVVRLHPGNMDAHDPNSPVALAHKQTGMFSDESFLPPLAETSIPQPAHFVETGDFNADGRLDVVTAAQGGTALFWLAGNGQGGFEAPVTIEVDGLITAFAGGEINQPDGARDLVVAITRGDTALALVFESITGGLFGKPEPIRLPFPAPSLALGRVNDDSWSDLVVAAGTELLVIQGRDRLSVLNEPSFNAALKTRRIFSEPVVTVVTGRFTSTTHDDIALSTQSGEVLVLDDVDRRRHELPESENEASTETRRPVVEQTRIPLEQWQRHSLGNIIPQARLVATKTSSLPTDDLMVVGAGSQLRLLTAVGKVDSAYSGLDSELVELSAFTPPVAAIPMRLNGDGLDDLVILSDTEQPLSKLVTEPLATFVVTNTGDNGGVNPAANAGTGTLRQAIVDANATVAADMISFNIAGAGVQTITLAAALPNITRPVTIDGTTQPGASTGTWPPTLLIELNGTSAGAANGLNFTGANSNNSLVKGLIINRFNTASPNGIGVRAAGPTNITVQYNLIGTDATGNAASANRVGISISGNSASCVIGGTTVGERNLVSGNSLDGINVSSDTADGAIIRGNIVGLNAAGTVDLGNTVDGIGLSNSVDNVTIGGSTASDRNIISGNDGDGIDVNNLDISGTLIQGNYIGTDITGASDLGNTGRGISNNATPGTAIGGSTATPGTAPGNVISGNNDQGIEIINDTADGVTVRGNIIGLNAAGNADVGNTLNGVRVATSADNTAIGGTAVTDRNVISGNDDNGVNIADAATPVIAGTTIQGNFIGTDITGAVDLGNTTNGIAISNAPATAIGGAAATPGMAPGNVISGNNGQGIDVRNDPADGTTIQGNIVGLTAAGTADLGNTQDGIRIANSADNTAIGGMTATVRNVISGNDDDGIDVNDNAITGTVIQGNYIGTDLTGAIDLGNTDDGIANTSAPGTTIGGSTATPGTAPGNVISGNNGDGVEITNDAADGTTFRGNIIGLTAAGTTSLGNGANGILVGTSSDNTVVGGSTASDRNIISGNTTNGIDASSTASTGTMIQGNYIGTDINGTADLGNGQDGITTSNPACQIGGSTTTPGTAPGNVISGNDSDGISISNDAADGCTINGNIIGLSANGTADLGNSFNGVQVSGSADNTLIGGTTANDRNIISGNDTSGILLTSTASTGSTIQGNYIGTDLTGALDLGNTQDGLSVTNTPSSQIGGTTTTPGVAPGNVISGNNSDGVEITGESADATQIQGNIVGLGTSGTVALGNSATGITVLNGADNTVIGGSSAMARNVISSNGTNGVSVSDATTTGTQIQGDYIGTDIAGTADLGNTTNGIFVSDTVATIGGSTTTVGTAPGNVVSGNNDDGIEVTGDAADANPIRGNLIGLNVAGNTAIGNGANGIFITNSADTNTVGGTTANDRNVISGNILDGVRITTADTTGNVVIGNFIGTNLGGTAAVANQFSGVRINGCSNNRIGGTTAAERNILSGNTGDGVVIIGAAATGNTVSGNFIGTDVNGTADLGNSLIGVEIIGSSGNTVGGTTAGERNIISGNTQDGVSINTGPAANNLVIGNYIGTNLNGTAALANDFSGVRINGCSNNIIGGTTPAHRNILSGNTGDGVVIVGAAATGNQVIGNFIGTDVNGTADVGNSLIGVEIIGSSGNTVGGTTAGERNIISGNTLDGVSINTGPAANNVVTGNYIGTDLNGTTAIANSFSGVRINGCSNNRIGGMTAGERNILSGNTGDGVVVLGTATGNQILGNYIGTTGTGTTDLGNLLAGIEILTGSSSTEVRGNVISCNHRQGGTITALNANIYVTGSNSNTIAGNIIGLQADGSSTFAPNGGPRGVFLAANSNSNQIGGTTVADRNIISGHQHTGVEIASASTLNQVQGNFIGVAADGTTARGNGDHGIAIAIANSNLIGGTNPGEGNVIASNGRSGVGIASGTGNRVLSNSIFGNTVLGIDLGNDGVVQANDAGDGDSGGNNLQNFPVLSAAYFNGTTTQIQGTLNSTAGRMFRIEFFTNPTCDGSGNGEGQTLLSSTMVTTNGSGNATINVTLAMATTLGQTVTATATDQTSNDTSEFSACRTITLAPPTLTKSFTPDTILVGQTSVLTFTITNPNSNSGLSGISFTDPLPGGVLIANPNGLVNGCGGTVTATSGTGTITYGNGNLAASGSCTFSVTVLGATTGTKVNTTNPISAMESGPGGTATATLVVGETVEFAVLYVADTSNNRIQRFDGTTWAIVGTGVVGSGNGQFRAPEAVTASPSGLLIYVADTNNNRIQWSTDGGTTWDNFATVGSAPNQVRSPHGLALDRDGNLYVSDTGNGRVMRFTGGVPGAGVIIATSGAASGQVSSPRGLAINSAFELFVADETNSRILKINNANTVLTGTTGTIVATAGSALNKVQNPQGIAVDNTGNVYVADTGNSRILRWANSNPASSTSLALVGTLLGQVNKAEGITVCQFASGPFAGQSSLVVGDTLNNRIQGRFLASGPWALLGAPNGIGSGVGQFRAPSKIR